MRMLSPSSSSSQHPFPPAEPKDKNNITDDDNDNDDPDQHPASVMEKIRVEYFTKNGGKSSADTVDTDKYLSSLLAQELTKLTLQEREKSYEELHGVDDVVEETPDFIAERLKAMQVELDKITTIASSSSFSSKNSTISTNNTIDTDHFTYAYCLAGQQDQEYVTNPKRRLAFLRADRFDPSKAARRMVAFFEGKLHYFGEALLTKDITYNHLDPDDQACLQAGNMQLLPSRDRGGRAIFCDMDMANDTSYKRPVNRLKIWIYIMLTLLEEEENQKRGIVIVLTQLGRIHPFMVNPELSRENPKIMKWIPLRVSGFHYCIEDPLFATLCRLTLVGSPPDIRTRNRIHFGTHTELMYAIMTFGIPVDLFPMNAQNVIKKTNHNRWIARRKIKESALQQTGSFSGIDLPNRQDVLMGKGRPIQEHYGNVKFREIIEAHVAEYTVVKRGQKAVVVNRILDAVKASSARFLAKDSTTGSSNNNKERGKGWWNEISDKDAREKISKTLLSAGNKIKSQSESQTDGGSTVMKMNHHLRQDIHEQASTTTTGAVALSSSSTTGSSSSSILLFQPQKRQKFVEASSWNGWCSR